MFSKKVLLIVSFVTAFSVPSFSSTHCYENKITQVRVLNNEEEKIFFITLALLVPEWEAVRPD
jgi:hypothetical protein